MALLSNINDKFAVDSTGAIQFNGQVGTSGYVLKSNANAAPTWVDPSTVIGGPYLPLTGGTLTGNLAISGSNSLTVGGTLTGTTATFSGIITASSSSSGDYVRLYGSSGTGKWDIYGNGANLRISDNESAGILVVDTGATFGGNITAPSVLANSFMEIRSDTASLYFENAANNNYYRLKRSSNDFVIDYYNGTTTSDRLTIDSSGQITNTMSGGKVLTDTNGFITSFQTLDTATAGGRYKGKSNRGLLGQMRIEQTATGADGGYITFDTSPNGSTTPTERMRITSGGKVIVGTNSSNALEVFSSGDTEIGFSYATQGNVYAKIIGDITTASPLGGEIAFQTATGGALTERMRITSSGNVGIGTASPNYKLEVRTSSNTRAIQAVNSTTSGTNWGFQGGAYGVGATKNIGLQITAEGASTNYAALFDGGNVGIGTTSPNGVKFQTVQTTSGEWTGGFKNYTANGYGLRVDMSNSSSIQSALQVYTGAGTGFVVKNTGNVGIGTTNPTTRLSVSDGAAMYADNNYLVQIKRNATNSNDNTSKSCILLANNSNAFQIAYGGTTDRLRFINGGGVEQMTLLNGGNVGIGRTDPNARLDIKGAGGVSGLTFETSDASNNQTFYIFDGGRAGLQYYPFTIGMASGTSAATGARFQVATTGGDFVILNDGKTGIGTATPTYKLHVVNSNNVSIFEDTSNASGAAFIVFNRPGVFSMGSITRNGSANSVSYNTGSDYRLKEDLKDFNALDLVNNITAYDYKWKDVDQRDYGFIAHELSQTLPNVVTGKKDGEKMQGVDYSKLTPILLKAIQELEARVKELENK